MIRKTLGRFSVFLGFERGFNCSGEFWGDKGDQDDLLPVFGFIGLRLIVCCCEFPVATFARCWFPDLAEPPYMIHDTLFHYIRTPP